MENDSDWLDHRLSNLNYVPDEGFTRGVVLKARKTGVKPMAATRRRILLVSSYLALLVLAGLLVSYFQSFVPSSPHIAIHFSNPEWIQSLFFLVSQPWGMAAIGLFSALIGIAAADYLRRWI